LKEERSLYVLHYFAKSYDYFKIFSFNNQSPRLTAVADGGCRSLTAAGNCLATAVRHGYDNPPGKIPYYRLKPTHFGN
jgi:hypothetical protein